MTLTRWSRQVEVVDITAKTPEESKFIFCWLRDCGIYRKPVAVNTETGVELYTVSLYNFQIAQLMHDIEQYRAEDKRLREMEEYENEH